MINDGQFFSNANRQPNQEEMIVQISKYKVIVIGKPEVGKSSIINRCVTNDFKQVREPTTEIRESLCYSNSS